MRLASATEEVAKNIGAWKQPKLRNSLRKYGYEAHKIEIVLQCSVHDLDMYEIKFMKSRINRRTSKPPYPERSAKRPHLANIYLHVAST